MDRRRFLTTIAATTAAYSLLPDSLVHALSLPAPTGGLEVVKHVVVFMQENRSFDHYFGSLRGVRGYGDRNALTLRANRKPVFYQPNGTGYVLPYGTDSHQLAGTPHGWADGHQAWNKGRYDQWVPAKGAHTMCFYDRSDLPFYYQLADAFTICDAYHCSVMGATSPNRSYHVTGMIGNEPDGSRATGNAAYSEDTHAGYTWTTYAERLESAGRPWKVYQEWDNYQNNNFEFFQVFKAVARKALAPLGLKSMNTFYGRVRAAGQSERQTLLARLDEGVRTLTPAERSLFERALRRVPDGQLTSSFRADVANGTLPAVSWIVAPESQCEHPSSDGPSTGSELVWQVLDALASNEAVWNQTVFLLNYDENDGYFDHVPPPVPPASAATEYVSGQPIGLGPRVPLLVVSPWSRGGYTCSELYDHTSVLKFLEKVTGVVESNISPWRRELCGDLTAALDTTTSDVYPGFTRPTPTAGTGASKPSPPSPQTFPRQEPGTRLKRKLPYQPNANARQAKSTGRVWIDMINQGTATTHFTVYANDHRTDGPWRYDVSPGRTVSDYFSVQSYGGGKYDLTCFGPNGFARRLAGDLNAPGVTAEVSAALSLSEGGLVTLTFTNTGTSAVTFTVKADAYRTDGPWTYTVPAGGTSSDSWRAGAYGDRWYDLTVTVSTDASFARTFRGYIENGSHGVTG
ncbi:phospholipase C, phosphocholine-specific [Nonomuraea africana]|uniref:Phospholipase C n=1 Tax=Nonomuraea africana TaxID=46171 RepID=A0ABR9KBX4_9ACTN|nr:phospholipase C, phosphocholine-specific [Nonomuraea africana]MBE1559507.1 phospholipase C [Nonomuraea africana]